MRKGKLFLGCTVIIIAIAIVACPITVAKHVFDSELIVKAISAAQAPNETALFWHNASYLGAWVLKLLALGALAYLSLIGWEIQCIRWNAKKK